MTTDTTTLERPAAPAAAPGIAASPEPAPVPVTTSQRMTELLASAFSAPAPSETPESTVASTPAFPEPGTEPSPGDDPTADQPATEPAADGELDSPPPPTDEDEPDPAKPEPAQKRINKLTAQKHELRKSLEAAQARLAELEAKLQAPPPEPAPEELAPPPAAPAPVTSSPLAQVQTMAELQAKQSEAQQLNDWVEEQLITLRRNPAQVETVLRQHKVPLADQDGQEDFSAPQMEAWLMNVRRNASRTLREIPQRAQFLQAQAQAQHAAIEAFPWWKDKSSAEYGQAQQILSAFPQLRDRPDWAFITGIQVLGIQELQKRQAQAGRPASPAKPAAVAPRLTSRPAAVPRVDDSQARLSAARDGLLKGKPEDYVRQHLNLAAA